MDTFLSTYQKDYTWKTRFELGDKASYSQHVRCSCFESNRPYLQKEEAGAPLDDDAFLKEFKEKHPHLASKLESGPTDAMLRKANEDRLKSTYQVDFCRKIDEFIDSYENDTLNLEPETTCKLDLEMSTLPCCRCLPTKKLESVTSKEFQEKKGHIKKRNKQEKGRREDPDVFGERPEPPIPITTGSSEYADTYSKLADFIINSNLHGPKPKVK